MIDFSSCLASISGAAGASAGVLDVTIGFFCGAFSSAALPGVPPVQLDSMTKPVSASAAHVSPLRWIMSDSNSK